MKNTGRIQQTNGTIEYVKTCVVCGATLLVEEFESQKDRHEMCGWKAEWTEELRLQAAEREQTRTWLARQ